MENETAAMAQMPQYQSHKKVWALKIKKVHQDEGGVGLTFEDQRFAARAFTNSQLQNRPAPKEGHYMVQYDDGYISFSPGEAFENGYTKIEKQVARTGHTFAEVIDLLKDGKKFARSGWNGKGMSIVLVPGDQWGIGKNEIFDMGPGTMRPWVGLTTVDGQFVPWAPSQSDMLADDWEIVE